MPPERNSIQRLVVVNDYIVSGHKRLLMYRRFYLKDKHISVAISSYSSWFYDSTYMYSYINDDTFEDSVCNFEK